MATAFDQPTNVPTNKVAAAGVAGAVTVIVVYLVKQFLGVDIPAEVASSFTAIVAFMSGYIVRETR